jgi:hypothetical protein
LFDFSKALELAKNAKYTSSKAVEEKIEPIISENTGNVVQNKAFITEDLSNKASLNIVDLISNSQVRLSSEKGSRYYYRVTRKNKDEFVKKYNLDLISYNYLRLHDKDEFKDYIQEFSFGSNRNIDRFIEIMNTAPFYKDYYKIYHKDLINFKVYYKYTR